MALGMIGLLVPVAPDADEAEGHLVHAARGVAEQERKIAVDAVPHGAAFRVHDQRFGDGQFAVLGDLHIGGEGADDLGRARGGSAEVGAERQRQDDEKRGPFVRALAGMRVPQCAAGARSTLGTAPSPAPSSKKARVPKPNGAAIRLLGKDCTSTLRLRTVPL